MQDPWILILDSAVQILVVLWRSSRAGCFAQVTKYKTRNGISSRDLLRLAHPKFSELRKRKREEEVDDMQLVLKFATHMDDEVLLHSCMTSGNLDLMLKP